MVVGSVLTVTLYPGDSMNAISTVQRPLTTSLAVNGQLFGCTGTGANLPGATQFFYFDAIMSGAPSWPGPAFQTTATGEQRRGLGGVS